MTLKGADKHTARLKRMQRANQQVVAALYVAGQQIEVDAKISITAGSVSGKGHVPSPPGSPPHNDTGFLAQNITTQVVAQNPPTVHVTSAAPYSAVHEFGGSRHPERPFMGPATEKNRDEVVKLVKQAVSISIK